MTADTLILLAIAIINLTGSYLAFRAHQAILVVERATNSMKDALVASTAKASYAEGHDAAQLAGTDKATDLAAAVAEAAKVLAALGAEKATALAATGRRSTVEAYNKPVEKA